MIFYLIAYQINRNGTNLSISTSTLSPNSGQIKNANYANHFIKNHFLSLLHSSFPCYECILLLLAYALTPLYIFMIILFIQRYSLYKPLLIILFMSLMLNLYFFILPFIASFLCYFQFQLLVFIFGILCIINITAYWEEF